MPCKPGGPKFDPPKFGLPNQKRGSEKQFGMLRENVPVSEEDIRARPLSGGPEDSKRVRSILEFYAKMADDRVQYLDVTEWEDYEYVANEGQNDIANFIVPDSRTIIVDWVGFYAKALGSADLLDMGQVTRNIIFNVEIGGTSPLVLFNQYDNALGTVPTDATGFPFLNQRVGSTEFFFSLHARTGSPVRGYYITRTMPPVALDLVGFRIRGFIIDSSIIGEILEAQR